MSGPPLEEFVSVNLALASSASPDTFAFGTPLGVFDITDDSDSLRVYGPYTSIDEVNDDGFDAATEPEVNAWASAKFSQDPRVTSILVGRIDALDANLTATLNAIEEDIGPEGFYTLNIESRTKANILLAAAWAEARGGSAPKLFVAQTADTEALAGTAENVMLELQDAEYHRTACIYHRFSDSTEGSIATDGYLDGAWSSRCGAFDLDGPGGRGTWAFKRLSGITADPLTSAQATNIYDANGNVFGRTKGLSFASKGTVASGRFIDTMTSLDWGRVRIGEAMLAEFVSEPNVIPFTNAGINRCAAVAQRILELGVRNGHFSGDHPRVISKPEVVDVPTADKVARHLRLTGTVTLAGGIHQVTYNITVEQ
jgi:hypothetical protein